MAFICFSITPADSAASAGIDTPAEHAAAGATSFSTLEQIVIAASAGDELSSLGEPGPWRRRLQALLGVRRKTGLADPRLEALRRMAVLLRHHGAATTDEIARFAEAGYAIDAYHALRRALAWAGLARVS